jgi:hypothetical protein
MRPDQGGRRHRRQEIHRHDARHFQFMRDRLPYFKAQEQQFHLQRANSFARVLEPRSLDDAGSMCAA